MKDDAELHDVSQEAESVGISLPVSIDNPLMETITPNSFLESLGVSREQRITNLLQLVRTVLHPEDESRKSGETKIPLPFMVLQGPLVREDCLIVTIRVKQDADGNKMIAISRLNETEE